MPVEIERKFLVVDHGWRRNTVGQRFCQGYLARSDGLTVRVRRAGPRAYLTAKGEPNEIVRPEFEYEVSWRTPKSAAGVTGRKGPIRPRYRI
jgi:adenylate cyclase